MPRKSKAKEEAGPLAPVADAIELGLRRAKEREAAGYWTDINDLTPWKDNPRKNDGRPVEAVMDSIKRFGFSSPIIARQEDGQVIAGHTRLKAAKALGLEQVPVRFMDLDPADAKLLALADNKLGELADWDDEVLARIVADVDSAELLLAGFSDSEVVSMLDPIGVEDVAWKQFDETIGDNEPEAATVECPHCGETFEA